MVKSWHRRWFVLNGDYLFYFAREDDVKPLGMLYLMGNKIIQHPANPEEPDKFLLEIVPGKVPQRTAPSHESFLLCAASDDERQDWIKAIRKVMFAAKGGAIFGTRIEEVMEFEKKRSARKVPLIMEACIDFLTKHGLETEGIFRLPGRMLLVRDLKDRFDEGETVNLDIEEEDVHSVASLLKQYLRELPECLIPFASYQNFMNIAMRFQGKKTEQAQMDEVLTLKEAMKDVPPCNYNALKYLCHFLHKLSENTTSTKMDAHNLARVFGPNIIRHPQMEDNPEIFMLTTSDISEQLAYMMIKYDEDIFTIEYDSLVAVDDLLRLDSTSEEGQILQPQTGNFGSCVQEIQDIVFEQRGDRRARSFQTDLMLNMPLTLPDRDSTDLSSPNGDIVSSPLSIDSSPTVTRRPIPAKKPTHHYDSDGKPVPPIRRKNVRNHSRLEAKDSNDSNCLEKSDSSNSSESSNDSSSNARNSEFLSTNEPNPALVELQQKLDSMSADYSLLRNRYDALISSKAKADDRVKNLSAELSKIQSRYDDHIKKLEERQKVQLQTLYSKIDEEKASKDEALQKIVELQKTLQEYKMQYGDIKNKKLPPLYQ